MVIKKLSMLYVFFLLTSLSLHAETKATDKVYPPMPFADEFGGPFKLTDHHGNKVSDKDYLGKFSILYFGYTQCADTCPLALYTISQGLNEIGELSKWVTPLFVNLDVDRKSLSNLEQYVHYFHPDFIGLTGTYRELAVAAGAYGIRYKNIKNEDGSTIMVHSGKIFLLGPNGEVVTYFPHEADIDWIASATKKHVQEALNAGKLQ